MGLMSRIDQRMTLMGEMFRQTDADLSRLPHFGLETRYRSAVARCLGCSSKVKCQQWLAANHQDTAPPAFCRNAGLIAELREKKAGT